MTNTLDAALIGCATLILAGPCRPRRIECHGNFQITKYGPVATPYCEEEQFAYVGAGLRFEGHRRPGAQRSAHQGLSLPDDRL